jgi:CRISPR-associated protein Cmr6
MLMRSRNLPTWEVCVREALSDLSSKNVISALTKAFVNCYEVFRKSEGGESRVSYVTGFSREASIKLYEEFKCPKIGELLRMASSYIYSLASTMKDYFDAVFLIKATLLSRLTIGTSDPTLPLEISIYWDPILNLPYVPSSSIKGLVRAYLKSYVGQEFSGELLDRVFGTEVNSGLAVFTDAYPVKCSGESLVEPDVVTPHYGEVREAIDEASSSPVPLVFPTVARGVTLAMIVAFRYSGSSVLDTTTVLKLTEKIGEALEQGIGARTGVGYGRARVSKSALKPVQVTQGEARGGPGSSPGDSASSAPVCFIKLVR